MRFLRKNNGFTLIELMIVIAVITILMNITITRIVTAREKAQFEACNSNLKNIATAMEMYHKKKNQYPVDNDVWVSELQGTRVLEKVPTCPLAKSKEMAGNGVISIAYAEDKEPSKNSYQYEVVHGSQSYRIYCSGDNRKAPHKNGKDTAGSETETYNWPQYSNVSGLVKGLTFGVDGSREYALLDGFVDRDYVSLVANLNKGDMFKTWGKDGTEGEFIFLGDGKAMMLNSGINVYLTDVATFTGTGGVEADGAFVLDPEKPGYQQLKELASNFDLSADGFMLMSLAEAESLTQAQRLAVVTAAGGGVWLSCSDGDSNHANPIGYDGSIWSVHNANGYKYFVSPVFDVSK